MKNDPTASLVIDYELMKSRAEAAEARAADLVESNRELSESVVTLRAEVARLKAVAIGAVRIVTQLEQERDEARRELQQIRTLIDDGMNGKDNSTLAMVKRLQASYHAMQRETWHERM